MTDDKRQRQRKFVRQLLETVDRGDFDAAIQLIDGASVSGLDVDQSAIGGVSVLQSIIGSSPASPRIVDVCGRLIAAGADVNRRNQTTGETPLHLAARSNRGDLIEVLLKSPIVEMDASDINGWTPLVTAVANGSAAAARCLVRAGCNVNK
jgi:hypothetical protein